VFGRIVLIHVNNEELQNLKSLVDKEMYEKKKKTKATPISLDSPHLKPILLTTWFDQVKAQYRAQSGGR
jgi:hypothetical protein